MALNRLIEEDIMALVDARGLSCPQPVLLSLAEMRKLQKGTLEILVDTDTSKENVSRAAASQGWDVRDVRPEGEGYRIIVGKN